MTESDPVREEITRRFPGFEVTKLGPGYNLRSRRDRSPIARLRPFPDEEDYELFYWVLETKRWRTFGPFGTMRLKLDQVEEIIETDPSFRQPRSLLRSVFRKIRKIWRRLR